MSHELDYTRRRRLDYGSGRRASSGFGAVSSAGISCPVPTTSQVPSISWYPDEVALGANSYTVQWCACMFGASQGDFNACVDPNKYFYPWTWLGRAERGWTTRKDITDAISLGVSLIGGSTPGGQGGSQVNDPGGSGGGSSSPTMNPALLVVGGLLLGKALKVF